MIRVLLVDDHASSREPLAFILDLEPDIQVVGQAGTMQEARSMLTDVDVAIIDIGMPDGNGIDLIAELHQMNPGASALVLTASLDRADVAQSLAAGSAGLLHKAVATDDIVSAIRRAYAGELLIPAQEAMDLLRYATRQLEREREIELAFHRLTLREHQVLEALADGLNDKQIAARLEISVETARRHMGSLLGKLGVQSRLQALVLAVRHKVVTIR